MQKIFVGDVQGCADELDALLARIEGRFGDEFELWVVGDVINRGPGSLRALARVRELVDAGRARLVLGNHEIVLLMIWLGLRALRDVDTYGEVLADRDADDWMEWLRRRSIVESASLGTRRFAMVHAAAHPDWSFDELVRRGRAIESVLSAGDTADVTAFLSLAPEQDGRRDDLGLLTRCRSIVQDGSWSSDEPVVDTDAWHHRWLSRGHDYALVYGHWSRQGLRVAPGLRGLDTGCVHHGRGRDGYLTAWLPGDRCEADGDDANEFSLPDDRFWQVAARRQYYGL